MLLSYHLPIIDLRPLLPNLTPKLDRPKWPLPQDDEFVRGFGKVLDRNYGGDDYFGGGSRVFGAHGVIRFNSTDPKIELPGGKFLKVDCKFRRFFAFSDHTAKIELGLTQKAIKPLAHTVTIEAIFEGLFNLPVSIVLTPAPSSGKKGKERVEGLLGGVGDNLAQALLRASTSLQNGITTENWWIQVGKPIAFLEFNKDEPFEVPSQAQQLVCSNDDIDVYKYMLKKHGTASYIIKRKNHNKARAKSRSLRVILGDLHCHVQSTLKVYGNLKKDRVYPDEGSLHAERIQSYVDEQYELLRKIIKDGARRKLDGSEVEIPIPLDVAEIANIANGLEEWKAAKPNFFRKVDIELREKEYEITELELKPEFPFFSFKIKLKSSTSPLKAQ